MSQIKANIASNFAAQWVSVILGLVVTPFIVKFLGLELYGLLAFYLLLQTVIQVLDLGVGTTVCRELARSTSSSESAIDKETVTFVSSTEILYWIAGALFGLALAVFGPPIANYWLSSSAVSLDQIRESMRIFGAMVALQWPLSFYVNGLMGLQRQVVLNAVNIPSSVASSVGGVTLLAFVKPDLSLLLSWQATVLLVQVFVLAFVFRRSILSTYKATVSLQAVIRHWRFAAGVTGLSVTGMLLINADKLVVSKIVSLEDFGFYSLAATVARALYVFITPVFSAYFPRLTSLVSRGDELAVRHSYHTGAQVMSVAVIPVSIILVLFSGDILFWWTHNPQVGEKGGPVASTLAIGTMLNAMMNIPFALQLAYGWTRLGLFINLALLIIILPLLVVLAGVYGTVGAAAAWAILNFAYVLVGIPLTHSRLLVGEARSWLEQDILPAVAVSILIVGLARGFLETPASPLVGILMLLTIWGLAVSMSVILSPYVRRSTLSTIRFAAKSIRRNG
jgi:O-antigen/teichoic acid export membrane protein